MPDLEGAHWRKSSRSNAGNCVEIATNLPSVVGTRDSKDPTGPTLTFSLAGWAAFLQEVKSGNFVPES
ncbi:DUF397 domain-containing protein [Micromonospora echinospora]|uniref:DUF397 domain-containing protein n=1 Tax=Micromonospora echinospora TaxID=1877 RepID=A0A1C4V5M9_MICEC|nr:DUF397 domain-containing protein [Micromonospora echinospora]OZV83106.1 DUF397 domain-containing protein [Micromonospora echinospora]SCE79323.1 protein of unknown function [Micromonospora echinospora]